MLCWLVIFCVLIRCLGIAIGANLPQEIINMENAFWGESIINLEKA